MITLFKEPRTIIDNILTKYITDDGIGRIEMSNYNSWVISGIIKDKHPKNILEVGVSAGGTSCIILETLYQCNYLDTQLISVDLKDNYFRDETKRTQYQVDNYRNECNHNLNKYELLTGHCLPYFLNSLLQNYKFDLVILDTSHTLPGEVLDFISIINFLNKDAIVILDDVIASHVKHSKPQRISNITLFSSITAEKIIPIDTINYPKHPITNIGVCKITDDTYKYISNVFYSLLIPWDYYPELSEINDYQNLFTKYFNKDLLDIFNVALQLNKSYTKDVEWIKTKLPRIRSY